MDIFFNRRLPRTFLWFAMLATGLVISLFLLIQDMTHEETLDGVRQEQDIHVSSARAEVEAMLEQVISDLFILAQNDSVEGLLQGGALDAAARLFTLFASERKIYDQLRVLDASGREALRIDYNGKLATIRPGPQLQDKSGRDYFTNTINLRHGTIYISRLDLNVEHGRIEIPLKPVLRMATPIKGKDGRTTGIVVINILGNALIAPLVREVRETLGEPMVIAPDGEILFGPDPRQLWGYQLGTGVSFGTLYPNAWPQLDFHHDRSLDLAEGLLTYRPTSLVNIARKAGLRSGVNLPPRREQDNGVTDYTLLLGSLVGQRELNALASVGQFGWTVLAGALICAWLLSFLLAWLRVRQIAGEEWRQMALRVEETTHDAVISYDADQRIIAVNPGFSSLLGYLASFAIGKPFDWFRKDDQNARAAAELFRLAGESGRSEGDLWARGRDGIPFPARSTISAIRNQDNGLVAYVEVLNTPGARGNSDALPGLQHGTDPLTLVADHNQFLDQLNFLITQCGSRGEQLALFHINLDGLPGINQTHGHQAGDQLLETIAQRLISLTRPEDFVARISGDEFALVIVNVPSDDGLAGWTGKLESTLFEPVDIGAEHPVSFSASIGAALFPEDGDDARMLITQADMRMYVNRKKAQPKKA